MGYTYSGSAHTELFASYAADDPQFRTHESPNFPERETVIRETQLLRKLLFPGCWNAPEIVEDETALREMIEELGDQFCRGIEPYAPECLSEPVDAVIDALPAIRQQLKQDVEAAYKGDPAATSYVEVIRAYPGVHAMMVHRVAHVLYEQAQQAYARELAEAAKTATGIDIHPGADIGEYVFIDHGSGVVIGETVTIGDWVRLYPRGHSRGAAFRGGRRRRTDAEKRIQTSSGYRPQRRYRRWSQDSGANLGWRSRLD